MQLVMFNKLLKFGRALKYTRAWIEARPSANLCIAEKNGGFAVKFIDEVVRLPSGVDVDAVIKAMEGLAKDGPDLIVIVTDGSADVCSSVLSEGCASQKLAVQLPFMGGP
jgi:hypothetical protein